MGGFQMTLLWAILSKKNMKTELSSQNYVDPAYSQLKIWNIFWFYTISKKALHRPAVRECPPTYNKRQPKGCNKHTPVTYTYIHTHIYIYYMAILV